MTARRIGLWLGAAALGAVGVIGYRATRPAAEPDDAPPRALAAPPLEVLDRREAPAPAELRERPKSVATASAFALTNREAIDALERGELDAAIVLFEQCIAGEPAEEVFRRNLAEALVRRALVQHERVRPCSECIGWLERAVLLAPERDALQRLLERWRTEAETEKDFTRDRSTHFELSYDGWREQLLDASPDILSELERHYIDLAELFGVYPGERGTPLIPVALYKHAEFSAVTGLADWAGASYDGTIRVPVVDGRGLDAPMSQLLRHELIHAFVRELGGSDVPAWLNEGLAQWLQRDPTRDLAHARRVLAGLELLPLENLQSSFAQLARAEDVPRAYAESLLLCEFLERQYGRATLVKMVAGCRTSAGLAASFAAWTRVSLTLAFRDFGEELARGR